MFHVDDRDCGPGAVILQALGESEPVAPVRAMRQPSEVATLYTLPPQARAPARLLRGGVGVGVGAPGGQNPLKTALKTTFLVLKAE